MESMVDSSVCFSRHGSPVKLRGNLLNHSQSKSLHLKVPTNATESAKGLTMTKTKSCAASLHKTYKE